MEQQTRFTNQEVQDLFEITRFFHNGSQFKFKGVVYTLTYGGATVRVLKQSGAGNYKEITLKRK